MNKIKENIELESIINHLENATGLNLRKKTNKREIVYLKVVYAMLALRYTRESLNSIGTYVFRDHCAVLHYRDKLSEVVFKDEYYNQLYISYNPNGSSKAPASKFSRVLQLCRNLMMENKRLRRKMKLTKNLNKYTPNELAYRELTEDKQKIVDMRLEPILKMMNYDRCI